MIFIGCERINQEHDLSDAEKISYIFYSSIREKKHYELYNLFSENFFVESDFSEIVGICNLRETRLGSMRSVTLKSWETYFNCEPDTIGQYALIYQVEFDNGRSIEQLNMEQVNGKIKVLEYRVLFN